MTTPLPVSPTPYITPELLVQAPTGISWDSIPPGRGVSPAQKLAEQSNICARATGMADDACHQPLRATIDNLMLYGPGRRVGARGNGPAVLIAKRWPVLDVISVQVARNCLPYVWATVPAELVAIQTPVSGLYGSVAPTAAAEGGQGILVSEQWVNFRYGPNGLAILLSYVNGWPHCGLTSGAAPVLSGTQEIEVDDCTGWAVTSPLTGYTGATGTMYDAAHQEVIQVTATSAASGPGTLTLASPLQFDHARGTIASTLPQNVSWAIIMFAVSQALARGATSTTVHQVPGGPGGRSAGPEEWAKCAKAMLGNYARII
jgi:hypothetical protein